MNCRINRFSSLLGIALSLSIAAVNAKVISLETIATGEGGFGINGIDINADDGFKVTGIGDVNADGRGDFLVAVPNASPNNLTAAGVVYVVFGKNNGDPIDLNAIARGQGGYAITGLAEGDNLGTAVSAAGDVNGDEIDDFIIHAPNASPNDNQIGIGVSYVIYGWRQPSNEAVRSVDLAPFVRQSDDDDDDDRRDGFAIFGIDNTTTMTVVSQAGNVNNDAFDDILIGKPDTTVQEADGSVLPNAGAVYVILGKRNSNRVELREIAEGNNAGFVINGFEANSHFGAAIASAGNVNDDNLDDFIVGAPDANLLGENIGQAFVIFGFETPDEGRIEPVDLALIAQSEGAGFVINGANDGDELGFSVNIAGDVNDDGRTDIIVGAPRADALGVAETGAAYVVFGKSSNAPVDVSQFGQPDNRLGFAIFGINTGDETGFAVGPAGNFNDDAFADIAVAAPKATPITTEPPDSGDGLPPPDTNPPPQPQDSGSSDPPPLPDSDTSTQQQASGGDVSPQVLPQSNTRQGERENAGIVFTIPGQNGFENIILSDLQNGVVGNVINGIAGGDDTGYSIGLTGDMNNDDLPDLLIAAPRADINGQTDIGQAFVLFSTVLNSDDLPSNFFPDGGIADQTVKLGNAIRFQIPLPDPIPGVKLRIKGLPPEEAHISPEGGVFSWKPRSAGTYLVTIVAEQTETNPIQEIADESFTIIVEAPSTNLTAEEVALLDDSRMSSIPPDELSGLGEDKVREIPPSGFSVMEAEQVSAMTSQGMQGMQPEQFQQLPKDSLKGINANNMGGLPPDVIREMSSTDLQSLDMEEMKQAPPADLAKFITNLEPGQVDNDSVKALLPDDWTLDENTGDLQVPKGTKLKFRVFDPPSVDNLALPELPDMSKGLGLGGQASRTLLDGVNSSLLELEGSTETDRFEINQKEDGILRVEGRGELSGVQLALIPDGESFEQTETIGETITDSRVTLEPETGRYIVITADNQRMAFRPAPHRPSDLAQSLGENFSIRVGDAGELIVGLTETDETQRRTTTVYNTYAVDPFLETSSQDSGIYDNGDGTYTIVYTDGTAQTATITVPSPSTFISEAYKLEGVEEVLYTSSGGFSVTYQGLGLALSAISQSTQTASGAEPYIVVNGDGTLSYGVQESTNAIITIMSIN